MKPLLKCFTSSQFYEFLLQIECLYLQQATNNNLISYESIDKLILSNFKFI